MASSITMNFRDNVFLVLYLLFCYGLQEYTCLRIVQYQLVSYLGLKRGVQCDRVIYTVLSTGICTMIHRTSE